MKKIIYISTSVFLLAILISSYFIFFHKPKQMIESAPMQVQPKPLDTRFWLLYGQISKINKDSLYIDVIKEDANTDYIFNNMLKVNVLLDKQIKIKKFDIQKRIYLDMKTTDLKIGGFITAYIEKATSTGYKATILELFDKNIILKNE